MKKLFFLLFLFTSINIFGQQQFKYIHIDTVMVTAGNPNSIRILYTLYGAYFEAYVDSIGFESLNDTNNTQAVNIIFKGCPIYNALAYFDTTIYLSASYPFALTVRAFSDTIGCSVADSFYLMDTFHVPASQITDVNEIKNQQNNIAIYPNPARQYVTVDIEKIKKNASISMYDIHGRLLKNTETKQAKTTIDISDLPNGVYMIRVNLDGVLYSRRISIARL